MAIFSNDWKEHVRHIETLLEKLAEAKLRIKTAKCKFTQKCVKYLGHLVRGGCRTPAEAKIKAVLDFPIRKTKTDSRKILETMGYYSRYIRDYSTLVEPLMRALKGKNRKEAIE